MRFKSVLSALFLFLPLSVSGAPVLTEGVDYQTLSTPIPMDNTPGEASVLELFWYGCPHCYQMEPTVQTWLQNKPDNTTFVRVPAVFNRTMPTGALHPWFIHAKAFYAAEALGIGKSIHKPLFHAIHEQNQPLRTEEELAAFFAKHGGVTPEKFKSAFNSFDVEKKAGQAMEITKASGASGVPAFVVNGKYLVLGHDEYLNIINYLIARDRKIR